MLTYIIKSHLLNFLFGQFCTDPGQCLVVILEVPHVQLNTIISTGVITSVTYLGHTVLEEDKGWNLGEPVVSLEKDIPH